MSCDQVEAAATRAAVVVAVPALGVVAHAHASGTVPTAGAVMMLAGVGVLAALVAVPRGRSPRTPMLRLTGVLGAAQFGSHLLLSTMGDAAHLGHLAMPGSGASSMVAAHAAAILVTAILIPAAAALAAFASSTFRALRCRPGVRDEQHGVVSVSSSTMTRPAVLAGGCGLRGPPSESVIC